MEIALQLTLSILYFKIYGVAAWESEKIMIRDSILKKEKTQFCYSHSWAILGLWLIWYI